MAFLLAALSVAVYINALFDGFVYDDVYQVLQNVWIRDLHYIPDAFTQNVWGFGGQAGNYYRPVMHLVYMADYYLFGYAPWGYHLTNILLHTGVTLLVYYLSVRILAQAEQPTASVFLPAGPAPFAAAAVFAVNPVHTEAVTWVAGLPEVSFAFFYLASLLLYIRSLEEDGDWYVMSVVLFGLACLSKETALTLPLLIICYEHFYRKSGERAVRYVRRYIPYFAVAVVYLGIRARVLGGLAPREGHPELDAYQHVINVFPLFSEYMYKMLLPIKLNAFHVLSPIESLLELKGLVSLAVAAMFAAAAMFTARRYSVAFMALAFIVVPMLPVFYISGLGENMMAERYLYVPSVGFSLLVGLAFSKLSLVPSLRKPASIVLVLVLLAYSAGTIERNRVWKDGFSLWSDTVTKSPDAGQPRVNLGSEYFSQGKLDEALEQYEIALRVSPRTQGIYNNIGTVYASKGMLDEAAAYFRAELDRDPGNTDAHNNLGYVFLQKGMLDEALGEYRAALVLNQSNAVTHNIVGAIYVQKGLVDEGIEEYRKALWLNPDYPDAHNNLGIAYFEKGMLDEAAAEHEAAVGLNPASALAHYRLGMTYRGMGRNKLAIAEYVRASTIEPNAAIFNNLGNAYAAEGRMEEALQQYRTALELDPGNEPAKRNIELALSMSVGQ